MTSYVPGVCNIGPAETRRRVRGGIAGTAATLTGLAATVALGLPRPARLLLALPAAGAAAGFLQARSRFCLAFGMQGLFNVGGSGDRESVVDGEARREDRRTALRLLGASTAIGAVTAAAAVLLPAPARASG